MVDKRAGSGRKGAGGMVEGAGKRTEAEEGYWRPEVACM